MQGICSPSPSPKFTLCPLLQPGSSFHYLQVERYNPFIMCVVTSVPILKCSNFRMLESNVKMFECVNALKLAEYSCVFFCLFFLHFVVLFVLKILVAPTNTSRKMPSTSRSRERRKQKRCSS